MISEQFCAAVSAHGRFSAAVLAHGRFSARAFQRMDASAQARFSAWTFQRLDISVHGRFSVVYMFYIKNTIAQWHLFNNCRISKKLIGILITERIDNINTRFIYTSQYGYYKVDVSLRNSSKTKNLSS
jgi:hypothetical protein